MKKCKMCNNMVDEKVEFCPYCGGNSFEDVNYQQTSYVQNQTYYQPYQNNSGYPYYQYPTSKTNSQYPQKKGKFGWAVLGFLLPIVGLILYAIWNGERKGDAKMAGIGALVGAGIFIVQLVAFFVIMLLAALSMSSSYPSNDYYNYYDYHEVSSKCCEAAGGSWHDGTCSTASIFFDEDVYDECQEKIIY